MAPRKKVNSLQNFSIQTLQTLVSDVSQKLVNDVSDSVIKNEGAFKGTSDLTENFRVVLYDKTPWLLHNKIAEYMFVALNKLYKDFEAKNPPECLPKCEAVVRLVMSAVPYSKLKKISFHMWARPIQLLLFQFLSEMSSLETLNCDFKPLSFEDTEMMKQKLLDGCHAFSNLTSFTFFARCNDKIVSAICENCKSIRKIDVSLSSGVTDKCIESVVLCEELERIELVRTNVSRHGYYKLLTESKSPNLVDMGDCWALSDVLKLMETSSVSVNQYQLPCLHYMCRNNKNLNLVCNYFPNLTELDIWFASDEPDLMCLSKLRNLKCLKIRSDVHVTDSLCSFLSVRGWSITSLCLVGVHELRDSSIINIATSCPNIENLEFSPGWQFRGTELPTLHLSPEPFQKLTGFVWESYFPSSYVEFVLHYAQNLETVKIRPSRLITDEFLSSVLNFNPLKRLRELNLDHSNKLSSEMLRHIIINFEHISYLSHFSISLIETEFESIKNFIVTNNFRVVLE